MCIMHFASFHDALCWPIFGVYVPSGGGQPFKVAGGGANEEHNYTEKTLEVLRSLFRYGLP